MKLLHPSSKVTAGTATAAIVTIAAFAADLVGVDLDLDPGVITALLGVVVFVVQYLLPERRPAPSAVEVVAAPYRARIAELEAVEATPPE